MMTGNSLNRIKLTPNNWLMEMSKITAFISTICTATSISACAAPAIVDDPGTLEEWASQSDYIRRKLESTNAFVASSAQKISSKQSRIKIESCGKNQVTRHCVVIVKIERVDTSSGRCIINIKDISFTPDVLKVYGTNQTILWVISRESQDDPNVKAIYHRDIAEFKIKPVVSGVFDQPQFDTRARISANDRNPPSSTETRFNYYARFATTKTGSEKDCDPFDPLIINTGS